MPTSVASLTIQDFVGNTKSLPVYFDDAASLADITTIMQGLASQYETVGDGIVVSIQVTLALALPGGLRTVPVEGNTVHEGALLSYTAADTARKFSVFVPGWANAGFAGDSVLTTGDYGTFEATYVTGIVGATADPTDQYSNDLTAFSNGYRTFRK